MTKKEEVYKCEVCGNIVEVLHEGVGTLVCCGKSMVLQVEGAKGEYTEKHAPIIDGKLVKVGFVSHPMTEEHYIEWIEATSSEGVKAKVFLNPLKDKEAKAVFCFEPVSARMYCNIHGLWVG